MSRHSRIPTETVVKGFLAFPEESRTIEALRDYIEKVTGFPYTLDGVRKFNRRVYDKTEVILTPLQERRGRPQALTDKQVREVRLIYSRGKMEQSRKPRMSIKELTRIVKEEYGVQYSQSGIALLLRRSTFG